MNTRTDQQAKG